MQFRQLLPQARDVALPDLIATLGRAPETPPDRPHVVVNFISSVDGRATFQGRSGGLGDDGDRAMFHSLRERADAVMVGSPLARAEQAPGRGYHWGSEATHPEVPRGERVNVGTAGTIEQILHGPSAVPDGSMNLMGALRRTMATAGYSDLKEFQRVEVVVAPGAPRDAHGPQALAGSGPQRR